jgi:hypothetical protein
MAQKAPGGRREETGSLMPPKNILNAPTRLMKQIGYGKGYQYDHDAEGGFPATITGPRRWSRRPSTSRPTAASRSASPKRHRLVGASRRDEAAPAKTCGGSPGCLAALAGARSAQEPASQAVYAETDIRVPMTARYHFASTPVPRRISRWISGRS